MKQIINSNGTGYQSEHMTVYNEIVPKNRSCIAEVVNILSSQNIEINHAEDSTLLPADIEEKIQYNNIQKSRAIIEMFKPNIADLERAYKTLEEVRSNAKEKILNIINLKYEEEISLGFENYNEKLKYIQNNSDNIFETIVKKLENMVYRSSNFEADQEDAEIAVKVILADAFINCLIMEKPRKKYVSR
jgi:hypothetical protein